MVAARARHARLTNLTKTALRPSSAAAERLHGAGADAAHGPESLELGRNQVPEPALLVGETVSVPENTSPLLLPPPEKWPLASTAPVTANGPFSASVQLPLTICPVLSMGMEQEPESPQ